MKSKLSDKLILIAILLFAAFLRFYDINWDQGQHLHPDERFLTLVGTVMKLPQSFANYLDPLTSTLNPANIGYKFYVYGTFPVTINKLIAISLGTDNYNSFTIQGRFLSGFFDLLIVLLIYKTLLLFEKKYKINQSIKYWGAFFYAIAVLPIQLSHFFAVDTFLNSLMFASFYAILKFHFQGKTQNIIASAIFLGIALASKITALFLLPLILFLLLFPILKKDADNSGKPILKLILHFGLFCLIFYLALRIADPYMFQTANFLDFRINQLFINNLKLLTYWFSPPVWYPPGVQWLSKTPLFPFANIAFFGLGLPYFIFTLVGMAVILSKPKRPALVGVLIWFFAFSIFESIQFAKAMRYFIIFYPFLAMFAAFGFVELCKNRGKLLKITAIILVLFWPLSFFSIYTKKHTRVVASEWIYKNIPNKSIILNEYWDDGLPLPLQENFGKSFEAESLPVFDPDTPDKWQKINTLLKKADYYILSSNRTWGSIALVPKRYPLMSKFYRDLFAEKTSYKKIQEFSSYPSLRYLGIPLEFPDQIADEELSVNDHPQVLIFKNTSKK